jgi:thiol:disulfide interchange protein DsbD
VRFEIAKGYYLYRDKFRFKAEPNRRHPRQASTWPARMKNDDLFGEVEVYYKEAVDPRAGRAQQLRPAAADA